ncbi:intermembrane transport protein PqiB [Sansalvadorimonas verongulae]|uniref:intermembrane transport protein PqiB n=1 Tax=Sansalvadorimonas verongulae TaxID=2172824 RepID=UPI0012BC8CF2|nr:intermembrane transport protein PqiB [Sansalvadorimonas verongulae]MTI14472.1 intermembrane transport protein PqiB [Sansalvadorimonas verongulae]
MMKTESTSMPEARVVRGRKLSILWLLPLLALMIGGWMLWYHYSHMGPRITISFHTADGIESGKTQVKFRNVVVGEVVGVQLDNDLSGINATVQMTAESTKLIHDDTRFWIVRPRVSAGGISGLSTLLSGTYIELSPGTSDVSAERFVGDENPPVSQPDAAGLRVSLYSHKRGSLSIGDPVLYSGFQVGKVEEVSFDLKNRQVRYQLFINEPYNQLVSDETRFWNASGIDLKADAAGVVLRMEGLETVLSGGVAFATPEGATASVPVSDNHIFKLYPDFNSTTEQEYSVGYDFVLLFDETVRGLEPGAEVSFRGIKIGYVKRIALDIFTKKVGSQKNAIPVVISVQPERIGKPGASKKEVVQMLNDAIHEGMRASLKSGNLLTGGKFVDVDFYEHEATKKVKLTMFHNYPVLPTKPGEFSGIGEQVSTLLTKLNDLPLEKTVADLNRTLSAAEKSMASLHSLLDDKNTKQLPDSAAQTLKTARKLLGDYSAQGAAYKDLQGTLNSLQTLVWQLKPIVRELSQQPNSLIFNREPEKDPQPAQGQ